MNGQTAIHLHAIDFHLNPSAVSIEGRSIPLTKTEFGTLPFLVRNGGTTFSRLISAVRGPDCPATDGTIDVQIVALR
jgi:DNA-binding response OmpR family regulator